jgi:pyruvate formate lyase activating enzyme
MVGREVNAAELMAEIERDIPFYDQSGGGVTFTGGEPLAQTHFLQDILVRCKDAHIHTAVDTSGHTPWENLVHILPLVDLFLYDLKLVDPLQHAKYTSVSNELILDNLHKLAGAGAAIIIRIPLIPGINDNDQNLETSAALMAGLPSLMGVEVMPYHGIGVAKFEALGMSYKLAGVKSPSSEKVEAIESLFYSYHLPVIEHSGRAV